MNRRQLMANVARGVKLFDEKDPLWWNGGEGVSKPAIEGMVRHIDLEKLDMRVGSCCVLGQRVDPNAEAKFSAGLAAVGLCSSTDAERYGFDAEGGNRYNEDCSVLTELWASVIQSRRFPRRKIARDPWIVKVNRTWVREVRS